MIPLSSTQAWLAMKIQQLLQTLTDFCSGKPLRLRVRINPLTILISAHRRSRQATTNGSRLGPQRLVPSLFIWIMHEGSPLSMTTTCALRKREHNNLQERAQQPARSILHRSVSVGNFAPPLSSSPLKASGIRAADSAVSSPVTTPLIESPGLSKIPSPVFDASLARPRREDSSSSFLTAIRASDGDTNHSRGTSRSSNLLESPRLSSRDSVRSSGDLVNGQRHSGRYGTMHDVNNIAVVAARAAAPSNSPKPSAELHGSYRANA